VNIEQLRLERYIFECKQHIAKMDVAYSKLSPFFPLTKTIYQDLNSDIISYLDQYFYRFSRLQDCLGQKLFKAILVYKQEEVFNKSFIDILHRLEQLEYICDSEHWLKLRNMRNQLAHDYEDNLDELIMILNAIFAERTNLQNYYFRIIDKLNKQ
jgi:hypothetical protein